MKHILVLMRFIKKTTTIPIILLISFLTLLTACNEDDFIENHAGMVGDGRLDFWAEYFRAREDLPAITAVVIHEGNIVEKTAVGYRSTDISIQVTDEDQWHIGSLGKPMLAYLTALMVKEGILSWDMTLAQVFPELVGLMQSEYESVRVDEILSHTSGLPNMDSVNFREIFTENPFTDQRPITVQRYELIKKLLIETGNSRRGDHEYNNLGYVVAATILEKMTGLSREHLMQTYIFEPLMMVNTGFGDPKTEGSQWLQPVGHTKEDGAWIPVIPEFGSVLPPVLHPPGEIHSTLSDMAAFLTLHLKGIRGEDVPGFLTAEQFSKLFRIATKPGDHPYGLGWTVTENGVNHYGSNDLWLAYIELDRQRKASFFVVVNSADFQAREDLPNSVVKKAIDDFVSVLKLRVDTAEN